MAMSAQVLLSIMSHETTAGDISRSLRATPATYWLSLTDGTGANQAQIAWSGSLTQQASNDDIDLTNLSDDRGTVAFTAVKLLYIKNTSESAGIAALKYAETDGTPAYSNAWLTGPFQTQNIVSAGDVDAAGLYLPAGGAAVYAAPTALGYSVSSASRILRVSAAIGATYEIVIIGEGAVS